MAEDQDNSLLGWLKRQKEIIALILFFSGGFSWIYAQFVTQAQLSAIQCIMQKQIELQALAVKLEERQQTSEQIAEEMLVVARAGDVPEGFSEAMVNHLNANRKRVSDRAAEISAQIDALSRELSGC